ncbi:MAG: acyltransferase family protein [Microbacteriaceae bacterium]
MPRKDSSVAAEQEAVLERPSVIERDSAVDLVKAVCLIVVVGLHAMMAGITVGEDGLAITNALEGHPIFAWATWAVQIMPLFFLLGGFSSMTQWRRMKSHGASAGEYIRQRVYRLAHPALLPLALIIGCLAAVAIAGVPNEVVSQVGFRIGQPLWFLAVYLGCAGFIPLMATLHERAPKRTLFGLLASAIAIDTLVAALALPVLGAFNFLFVWLFVQQLGFWYADGWFLRRNRLLLFGMFLTSFGVLVFLTVVIGYSTDMYVNLNPPTICILVLGVGQIALFSWAHPYLQKLSAFPSLSGAARAVNSNSMTIYLWHVPVVVIVALTMLNANFPLPEPLSDLWWQTRPLFFAAIAVGLIPVVLLVAMYDRTRKKDDESATPPWLAAIKVFLAVVGVGFILVVGVTPVPAAAIGLALIYLAVRLQVLKRTGLRERSLRVPL